MCLPLIKKVWRQRLSLGPRQPAESTSASFFHVCMSHNNARESADVAEVFSLPRVVPRAEQKGLRGLKSYDIGTGWDFLRASHRKQCLNDIREHRPRVVMVSPAL